VTREAKTPDGQAWRVRRLLLPAKLSLGNILFSTTENTGGSSGSFLGRLVFGLVFGLLLGLLLLPITLIFRLALRRWTVEARSGDTTRRWRATSRGRAGAGVEAIAGAIGRGESLDQQFAGLTSS
jgi:hypothetical protein